MSTARRAWGLVLSLWIVDALLAAVVVAPLMALFAGVVSGTTIVLRLERGLDVAAWFDVLAVVRPRLGAIAPLVALVLVLALVLRAASVAAVHAAANGERLLREQAAEAARRVGAYFVIGALTLPAWSAAGTIIWFAGGALWSAGDPGGLGGCMRRGLAVALTVCLVALLSTWVAYARAYQFRTEGRAIRALAWAARFMFWRRPLAVLAVAGAGSGSWLITGCLCLAATWWIPSHGWALVALLAVLRQALVITRIWVKVAWTGGELCLCRQDLERKAQHVGAPGRSH